MRPAIRVHWREYLIEALGLGAFMLSACVWTAFLEHPDGALHALIGDPLQRRAIMGVAMGLTAVAIIDSPWGRRSGAHINPAVTLAFLRLGRIAPWDAVFYGAAQFIGSVAGVLVAYAMLGSRLAAPTVQFVVTTPGPWGVAVAFGAELVLSAILFGSVLASAGSERWRPHTGRIAGLLVGLFIAIESPVSGMSINPARSFGSSAVAGIWAGQWIYYIAPPLGMLISAELGLLYERRGRSTDRRFRRRP